MPRYQVNVTVWRVEVFTKDIEAANAGAAKQAAREEFSGQQLECGPPAGWEVDDHVEPGFRITGATRLQDA